MRMGSGYSGWRTGQRRGNLLVARALLLFQPPDLFETLADALFDSMIGWPVVAPSGEGRWETLHVRDCILEFVRVLIALAVSPRLHEARGRVAKVHGRSEERRVGKE